MTMYPRAHSTDIVAYTYRADIYCPACTLAVYRSTRSSEGAMIDSVPIGANGGKFDVEFALNDYAAMRGINRMIEWTFDSDEFPKVVFRDQVRDEGDEAEETDRCGRCGEVLA